MDYNQYVHTFYLNSRSAPKESSGRNLCAQITF